MAFFLIPPTTILEVPLTSSPAELLSGKKSRSQLKSYFTTSRTAKVIMFQCGFCKDGAWQHTAVFLMTLVFFKDKE